MSKSIKKYDITLAGGKVVRFVGNSPKQIVEALKSWKIKIIKIRPLR